MSDCVTAEARNSNLAETSLARRPSSFLLRVSIFRDSYAQFPSRRHGVAREKTLRKALPEDSPFDAWGRAKAHRQRDSQSRTSFFPPGDSRAEKGETERQLSL
jgi:hypothetical protein